MSIRVKVGERLPPISGDTAEGRLALASFVGDKHVVLWTYPMDDTPGCTVEAQEFTARASDFAAAGAALVGLSKDDVASHRRFIEKYGLNLRLIADPDGRILKQLGVEREPGGLAKRTTFIVDVSGVVRHIYENVTAKGHAEAVLAAVKAL